MALSVNTNVTSMNAQNQMAKSQEALKTSFARLASGMRINNASDDAAGLGIAKSMNAQVRSYAVAERNTNDGISMLQTADGGAEQVHGLLTRMRELAVQASNGSMSSNDLTNIDAEYQQNLQEIDRVAGSVQFNGINLSRRHRLEDVPGRYRHRLHGPHRRDLPAVSTRRAWRSTARASPASRTRRRRSEARHRDSVALEAPARSSAPA